MDSSSHNSPIATSLPTGRRGLWGHLVGSATGAANDNFFRLAFTAAIQRLAPDDAEVLKPLLGLLFILPMLIMAPTAGTLGDRVPARRVMLTVRMTEIILVILGGMALWWESIPLMLIVLAGFGLQTAFFSPVKYASMPDITPGRELPRGNGLLQAATSLAILGGTALVFLLDPQIRLDTPFAEWDRGSVLLAVGAALAVIGVIATTQVRPLPAHNPQQRIAMPLDMRAQLRNMSAVPGLWGPTLSLSMFWAIGAVGQLVVVGAAMAIFGFNEGGVAILTVILGIGTAIGGLTASRLMVPAAVRALPTIGAFVAGTSFAIACLWAGSGSDVSPDPGLSWLANTHASFTTELSGFAIWLFITGIGGGWWAVSCNTILQQRADPKTRALAYSGINIVTNLGIITGFVILLVAPFAGLAEIETGVLIGTVTAGGAFFFAYRYRLDLARWSFSMAYRCLYRVESHDLHHLPEQGGCVLVANHQSFADGPCLTACLPRPTRPLIHASYVIPPLRAILRAGGCISVKPGGGRNLVAAIEEAVEAARRGEVVVVFAEGKLSRGCDLDAIQSGALRIAQRAQVPLIPLRIDGLIGSALSRSRWRDGWRWRRRVSLRFGAAMASDSPGQELHQAIQALGHQHVMAESQRATQTLGMSALAMARRRPFALACAELSGARRRLSLCAAALSIGKHFGLADDERRVGVLLPPGAAGTLTLLALALQGRCAVPLNHTVGKKLLQGMIDQAQLRTVISAEAYLSRIEVPELSVRMLRLEELKPRLSKLGILGNMLRILILPGRLLDQAKADEDAAIIFSSGSTGDPKGVRLSHRAILANGRYAVRHLGLAPRGEGLLTPLPLFHSFGLSIGTWLPMVHGITMISHPDPRDGRSLAKLAAAWSPSFLMSTPTFVRSWMRRMSPEDLAGLRFAVVGAEACPENLRQEFSQRYGAPLMEGYGATELGPVVSVGTPDVRDGDVHEIGYRSGSVGRPLPGIQVFTVDPDSLKVLPAGTAGLLMVRSPSVMSGYLNQPEANAKAFHQGAYNTGDIGRIDDHGFIYLQGRLSRFAKIGGEMLPLDRIEQRLSSWLDRNHPREDGSTWQVALTSVNHPERGERLVVLYQDELPLAVTAIIDEALIDEPPLFRPKSADWHRVEEIPTLGTGKRDLSGLKSLAEELAS
ncbi:MAG: MFS transporter [Planctomycetota bacterium]|nr:MAG: MFS transporter [Planctomycetota bacterium]